MFPAPPPSRRNRFRVFFTSLSFFSARLSRSLNAFSRLNVETFAAPLTRWRPGGPSWLSAGVGGGPEWQTPWLLLKPAADAPSVPANKAPLTRRYGAPTPRLSVHSRLHLSVKRMIRPPAADVSKRGTSSFTGGGAQHVP